MSGYTLYRYVRFFCSPRNKIYFLELLWKIDLDILLIRNLHKPKFFISRLILEKKWPEQNFRFCFFLCLVNHKYFFIYHNRSNDPNYSFYFFGWKFSSIKFYWPDNLGRSYLCRKGSSVPLPVSFSEVNFLRAWKFCHFQPYPSSAKNSEAINYSE